MDKLTKKLFATQGLAKYWHVCSFRVFLKLWYYKYSSIDQALRYILVAKQIQNVNIDETMQNLHIAAAY